MQHEAPVQLDEVRDFNQTITATITFYKQNWRMLFRLIAVLCLPLALVGGFLAGHAGGAFQQLGFDPSNSPTEAFSMLGDMYVTMLPGYVLVLVGMLLLVSCVHEYMRAYRTHEHVLLTPKGLFALVLPQLGRYFLAAVLMTLMIVPSFMLCLLPALYVGTIVSLTFPAISLERLSATGAIGRSINLVHRQFWPTLGLFTIVFIIYYLIALFVQLPAMIVGGTIGFNTVMESMHGTGSGMPGWFVWFNAVSTALQLCVTMLVYPIWAIARTLRFTSLVEEFEGHGLRKRMEGFGQA